MTENEIMRATEGDRQGMSTQPDASKKACGEQVQRGTGPPPQNLHLGLDLDLDLRWASI